MEKTKIIIAGSGLEGRAIEAELRALVDKHRDMIEIVYSMEDAEELATIRKNIVMPILAPIVFDEPFRPPLTRVERRKQARKK